ncbi:hypothetical protein EC844_12615 [Acinetobacter calcoaceticus]|uniref:Uncharacterized protein n=1 Tax=Acinetobacter calcoaceticus TaxID=471 RepID=A0A4R1XG71_ACICA|nr:hypothetical protein EC844_12615 [Acinetobacter calcoaceticus]
MSIGIPYQESIQLPLDMAYALLLCDGRQNNTRQREIPKQPTATPVRPQGSNTVTKTYISTERKHSKPKGTL